MSEKLTWELILGDPPEPDAEQLAYEKRCAANRRAQCLGCGRFVAARDWTIKLGAACGLPTRANYTCSSCGDMSVPLT